MTDLLDDEAEQTIAQSSLGWRYTLALAAMTKRCLREEMEPALRLEFLTHLEKMPGNGISAEAVAHVQPACERAAKIHHEVRGGSLDALGAIDVFRELARLNPSLIGALKLSGSEHYAGAWKET